MLKSLRIVNFESHKDTFINFTNGFNVIIGQSDGGKSSIIRAIAAVCYNLWENDSIRIGQDTCEITLETDKGVVILTKSPKNKLNTYAGEKFQNKEKFFFEAIGTSVPQIVYQITGMRELKIGDSSVDIPNIMFQLEKHYMLDEVSCKACTSNLIARIFDKVIGLGGMEQLITEISSSMLNDKKQITKKKLQCDQLQFKLISQQQIDLKQNNLSDAKELKQQIGNMQSELKKEVNRLKNIDSFYLSLDVDDARQNLKQLQQLIVKLTKINDFVERFFRLKNNLKINQSVIEKYKQLDVNLIQQIKTLCNKIYLTDKRYFKFIKLKQQYDNCDFVIKKYKQLDSAQNQLQQTKMLCNNLYKANKLYDKFSNKSKQLIDFTKAIEFYSNQQKKFKDELNLFKKENKICPLCGNLFDSCNKC